MAKIICFANSKGGVAKSTSCQNTGVILYQMGYKVLCVDVDAQSHLSVSFGIDTPEAMEYTLTNLLDYIIRQEKVTYDMVKKAIIKTNTVDLLPSTFHMEKLDVALNAINDREYALTDILSHIKDEYDFILLDCNSASNIFTVNALACADEVVIPSQTQYLSTGGIPLMLSTVKSLKRRINPNLKVKGILLTMYQSITNQSKHTVKAVKSDFKDMVFNSIIPLSTKVADAQKQGMSIIEYDKSNPVAEAYRNFVKELIVNE